MQVSIRHKWVEQLHQMAYPVIAPLSQKKLKEKLPLLPKEKKRAVAYLEAFGRTLCGIAPWLTAQPEDRWEAALQEQYITLIRQCLDACTDPASPDYFVWQADKKQTQNQPLVDAAFFVSGLLKAKAVLWEPLEEQVKQNVIKALISVSKIRTNANNNWCMFSARIESGLYELTGTFDAMKTGCALAAMESFYLGDGTYGDGVHFAWDYYNSYVMHPLLEEVTAVTAGLFETDGFGAAYRETVICRMQRYCQVQERMIAPDGTYFVTGRSSPYRAAAFQSLAHLAWRELLPASLPPGQVRNALNKVLDRLFCAPDLFDKEGFLRPGVYGCQPALQDAYINTGSLYLFSTVFLPLGLGAQHPFWQSPSVPITWERAWGGYDLPPDVTLSERKEYLHA